MTAPSMPTPLPFEALEQVYEQLAAALDRAGEANEALFLTKLVMVMAHRAGDVLDFEACVALALGDLALDVPADPAAC
jgi:hypothetical protein